MIFLFTKDDDKRKPVVVIRSRYRKNAQRKLIEVVDGHGYIGIWNFRRVGKEEEEMLLGKFLPGALYEIDTEKVEVV